MPAPMAFAADSTLAAVGEDSAAPPDAVRVAAPAKDKTLHLNVALAPRDPAALQNFVTSVSTPGSPQYHQYLKKGEFAAAFGPAQATIDATTAALKAQGLNPGPVSADGLSIPVTATVSQVAQGLHVDFAGYQLSDGRTAYANTTKPKLPASVAGAVTGIVGLNNFLTPRAHHTFDKNMVVAAPAGTESGGIHANVATPSVCAGVQNLLANNGKINTQNYWEPGSLSAASAYGMSALHNQYGNNGSGVSVGIFELESYSTQDIAAYQSCFGTNVPVTAISIDGGPTAPPSSTTGVGVESALDIETVAGLAPGVSIKVYQGPDYTKATNAQVLDVYRQMVTDNSVQVISTSWGMCEADLRASDPNMMKAEATIFQQAAAQGQTVVAASGDSGSTGCYPNSPTNKTTLSTDDPAGQPYVTAVGGTRMTLPSGAPSVVQSTWNTPAAGTNPGGASGGGVSANQVLSGPGNYQSGYTGAGYSNACAAAAGSFCRQVPDVSAVGDPDTGYLIAFGQPTTGGQYWTVIGGTSGGAPLWAAIAALADASHSCAANGAIGLMNPALYQNPSALTDITTGNNNLTASGYTGGLYQAGTGYDLATGLGTPKAPVLVEALCSAKPASAGSTFSAVGPIRVLDTRSATGVPTTTPLGPNSTMTLTMGGILPPSGVTAVVLNVTATEPTSSGFLTVYPHGAPRPTSSNLNFNPNDTIPNLVTVPVSGNAVDIYNLSGTVHVVADLFGYYSTNTGPIYQSSVYQPVPLARMLDTRSAIGVPTTTPLGSGGTLNLQVAGTNAIPTSGVSAVVLNVTATEPTSSGFLTVYPDGTSRPTSSNLNFNPNQTIPNLVTVPLGSNGMVDIYNFSGTVHVIADVVGYFTTTGPGYKFHASTPQRLLDTRSGAGVSVGQPTPIGPGGVLSLPLSDTAGPGNAGPLAGAAALMLNVTVTEPTDSSFVTVYPSGTALPPSSNLNFSPGQTIPNSVLATVLGSSINFYNKNGNVHIVTDLFGYYATN